MDADDPRSDAERAEATRVLSVLSLTADERRELARELHRRLLERGDPRAAVFAEFAVCAEVPDVVCKEPVAMDAREKIERRFCSTVEHWLAGCGGEFDYQDIERIVEDLADDVAAVLPGVVRKSDFQLCCEARKGACCDGQGNSPAG